MWADRFPNREAPFIISSPLPVDAMDAPDDLSNTDEADLPLADPFQWFERWFEEAGRLEIDYPNAFSLATVGEAGQPRVRTVLLKQWDRDGFVFYTNYRSRKGRDLSEIPRAGMHFYWRQLARQIRIEGPCRKVSAEQSDAYFASRPRGSQLGAWASDQSAPLESRPALEARYRELKADYDGEPVPRPSHWGGYRVVPERLEFWTAGDHRLHDRWEWTRESTDSDDWERRRLNP